MVKWNNMNITPPFCEAKILNGSGQNQKERKVEQLLRNGLRHRIRWTHRISAAVVSLEERSLVFMRPLLFAREMWASPICFSDWQNFRNASERRRSTPDQWSQGFEKETLVGFFLPTWNCAKVWAGCEGPSPFSRILAFRDPELSPCFDNSVTIQDIVWFSADLKSLSTYFPMILYQFADGSAIIGPTSPEIFAEKTKFNRALDIGPSAFKW